MLFQEHFDTIICMVTFIRAIEEKIKRLLFQRSMILILGPRQSGKTTLSKKIISDFGNSGAYYDCQLEEVRSHFVMGRPDLLLPLTTDKKIVVFDEAQTIQNIGSILKAYHDTYPEVQIIATGSSSFDLANKIVEPMTGRTIEFQLLPLSLDEIRSAQKITQNDMYDFMQYGTYPAIVAASTKELKEIAIKNIATNYLYKDVFMFEAIRNPKVFEDLAKLLAYQIGQMVSIAELAGTLGVSRSVVQKYLRLLEQAYIIKIIHSFSNNPRTELKKAFKVVFLDVGVRNVLAGGNEPLEEREDKGGIWENFFISERLKIGSLETFPPEILFWRTRQGIEVDVIEKNGDSITAYECKWKKEEVPFKEFLKKYSGAKTFVVSPSDFY